MEEREGRRVNQPRVEQAIEVQPEDRADHDGRVHREPVDLIPDFVLFVGSLDDLLLAVIVCDGILNYVDRGPVVKYGPGSETSLDKIARSAKVLAAWVPRRLKTRIFSSAR